MNRLIAVLLLMPLALHAHPVVTGAGRAGNGDRVQRTVTIGMADSMRFAPAQLHVVLGETLKLVARNDGAVMHEIVIGTRTEIARKREAMRRDPDKAHGAPYMAHVAPGASEYIVWTFDRPGRLEYACLLPGHYEAGMRGTITVR